MLNKIIPFLNERIGALKYFSTLYGLAEQVHKVQNEKEEMVFPAVFKGNDNFIQIELETLACYHRQTDQLSIRELENENLRGCDKAFEITYPMLFVGCLQHANGCQTYEADSIANSIAYQLYNSKPSTQLRNEVKAFSIEVTVKGIDTDRKRIWDKEYENVEKLMTYDKIYLAVEYDLRIKGSTTCLNILQC